MERTTTRRMVRLIDEAKKLYREVIVEIVATYDKGKLQGTEEKSRKDGGLFRLAAPGEAPTAKLTSEKTYEVLNLVAVEGKVQEPAKADAPATVETKPAPEPEAAGDTKEAQEGEETVAKKTTKKAAKAKTSKSKPAKKATPAKKAAPKAAKPKKEPKAKAAKPKAPKAAKPPKAPKAPKAPKPPKAAKEPGPAAGKYGQNGPALDLKKLNAKEAKVLAALSNGKASLPLKAKEGTDDLTHLFISTAKNKVKACSWARNSLRKLVRGGLVKKVARGCYEATAKGRSFKPTAASAS